MSEIPDDIMEAARAAYADSPIKVIGELEAGTLIRHIAQAIQAAEKRGEQREREKCLQIAKGFPGLAYAIRNT